MTVEFECPVCAVHHTCDTYSIAVIERTSAVLRWCCSEECAVKSKQYAVVETVVEADSRR